MVVDVDVVVLPGVVCEVFVCWLRVDIVPLNVVLGAFGSLRLLLILTTDSVSYPRPGQL
jgi:hypothetical protein